MTNGNAIKRLGNQKILITGGAGYLASNLCFLLKNTNCTVYRVDRSGSIFQPISGKLKISDVVGDICDPLIWSNFVGKIDIVFHFAAQTSVYKSANEPAEDLNVNVLPMLRLINAFRSSDRFPFIAFSGTVTETGLTNLFPVDETFRDQPITIYDIHKLTAENYLKYYVQEGMASGAVLRLSNVFGPGPRSSSADRGVLNGMIRKALRGETLTIYGEGNYIRDYIFVEDVARAFLAAAVNKKRVNGNHYIIGSGQGTEFRTAVNLVAERVEMRTGRKASVIHIDPPKALSSIETRNFTANINKFKESTGWNPRISLVEGIDKTIDSILNERDIK